jgi:hypothetical protein
LLERCEGTVGFDFDFGKVVIEKFVGMINNCEGRGREREGGDGFGERSELIDDGEGSGEGVENRDFSSEVEGEGNR